MGSSSDASVVASRVGAGVIKGSWVPFGGYDVISGCLVSPPHLEAASRADARLRIDCFADAASRAFCCFVVCVKLALPENK